MKSIIAFCVLAATLTLSACAALSSRNDPMCPPLRSFVASVMPDESRAISFHTIWGGNFKGQAESVIFAKRCIHDGYVPAKPICKYLTEHGATEFAGRNAQRAISCLADRTKFDSQIQFSRGVFRFSYGTPDRGSLVEIEFGDDKEVGGELMRINADGY